MSLIETTAPAGQSRELTLPEQLKVKEVQFKAALPAHIPVERFLRVVMTAIQNNPALAHADRQSLWNSCMRAAQDGLLPDGREGALVIYKTKIKQGDSEHWIDKVQWLPMIAGLRKKVRNSGEIATWDAHVVYERDEFAYELGDEPFVRHKPYLGPDDPGPVIAAYSVAVLKSGEKTREVMTRAQLDKVRGASKSRDKGPWAEWFEEMCRKTVARRHSKVLPMSTDIDDLLRRDDDLYDFRRAKDDGQAMPSARPSSLSAALDALAKPIAESVPIEREPDPEPPHDATAQPDAPAPTQTESTSAPEPVQQPLDPIDFARRRGAHDRNNKVLRRAVPPEYRTEARQAEANAWRYGWDNPEDVLAET